MSLKLWFDRFLILISLYMWTPCCFHQAAFAVLLISADFFSVFSLTCAAGSWTVQSLVRMFWLFHCLSSFETLCFILCLSPMENHFHFRPGAKVEKPGVLTEEVLGQKATASPLQSQVTEQNRTGQYGMLKQQIPPSYIPD